MRIPLLPTRSLDPFPFAIRLGARSVRALPQGIAGRFVRDVSGDGEQLRPEMHYALLLRSLARTGDAASKRIGHRRMALGAAESATPVRSVTNLVLGGPDGPLPARLYSPDGSAAKGEGPLPLLVYYHGGGFVTGDLDAVDQICRLLCAHGRMHVFSVDYRLAPEHPFPAALEDAEAAFGWAQARADLYGADPARVAVGGDSAGGTLAATVARRAAERHRLDPAVPVPAAQLLLYPSTYHHSTFPSRSDYGSGYFLEQEEMDWFFDRYVAAGNSSANDPEASPLLVEDLTGLPPALIVTATFDPLRDEAEEYAMRLQDAGVPVMLRRVAGMLHGFCNMTGFSRAAHDAVVSTAGSLAAILQTSPSRVPSGGADAASIPAPHADDPHSARSPASLLDA
jgi:acetyl esterase